MLFLTRKIGESVIVNDDINITVTAISGRTVKLGIKYPKEARVYRQEIYERIQKEEQDKKLKEEQEKLSLERQED